MSVIIDIKKTVLYGKGHEDGVAEGKEAGIAEGIAEGKKAGITEGEIRGQLKTARGFWEKGVSLDTIKSVVNIPEKDCQDFLKSIGQE